MLKSLFLLATLAVCPLCNADEPDANPGPTICIPKDRKPVVESPVFAPAEHFIGPNLPCFTKQMTDNEFKWWVIEQNEIATNACRVNAQPATGTAVYERTVFGWSSGLRGGFNNLHTREFQAVAPGATPYGGGPLWIHNPYVRH
jgi:hypothetical protein